MGDQEARGAGAKVTGIWHVVRLREMLQKWQSTTVAPRKGHQEADRAAVPAAPPSTGISPAVDKRLKMVAKLACPESSDEEGCNSPEPPPDVPKGYLAVYVGQEHRRFVIPTGYLGEPVFKELLRKAEEEFGFEHDGAITFPCEIEAFKYILQCTHRQHHRKNRPGSRSKNCRNSYKAKEEEEEQQQQREDPEEGIPLDLRVDVDAEGYPSKVEK